MSRSLTASVMSTVDFSIKRVDAKTWLNHNLHHANKTIGYRRSNDTTIFYAFGRGWVYRALFNSYLDFWDWYQQNPEISYIRYEELRG